MTVSADYLPELIEQKVETSVTAYDLNHWMDSKYEPLPTVVDAANADSEANTYRINSYRVLLTRGRDGFIAFVPDEDKFNTTYDAFIKAGLKKLS